MLDVFVEALVVGVVLVIITAIVSPAYSYILGRCDNMAILFASGFLFHVICEVTGVNRWYVMKKKDMI
jgi:hypothetical protein